MAAIWVEIEEGSLHYTSETHVEMDEAQLHQKKNKTLNNDEINDMFGRWH